MLAGKAQLSSRLCFGNASTLGEIGNGILHDFSWISHRRLGAMAQRSPRQFVSAATPGFPARLH